MQQPEQLKETICRLTKTHLEDGMGRLYAQCVKAVGWIGGTVPDTINIVELPTSDVCNGGVVVGAALAGERPIYVIRYQGFMWYNLISIINYAAKSLEMWHTPCPILVRALGMEGNIGPVAGSSHCSIAGRTPGIIIKSPITPKEWECAYKEFMLDDKPYIFNESRLSFTNTEEFNNYIVDSNEYTLFLIGAIRLQHYNILKQIPNTNIIHISNLIPLDKPIANAMNNCKFGIVVDSDYTSCSLLEHVAYEYQLFYNKPIYKLGLDNRCAGFSNITDNITPTVDKIKNTIMNLIYKDN